MVIILLSLGLGLSLALNAYLIVLLNSPERELEHELEPETASFDSPALGGLSSPIPEDLYHDPTFEQTRRELYPFPLNPGSVKRIGSLYGLRKDVFGNTNEWRLHEGIDVSSHIPQDDVYAVADGVVISSYPPSRPHAIYGAMVKIQHNDGTTSLYAHLSLKTVVRGTLVKQGQIIGKVGNTGLSTAEHLHFEIDIKNKCKDPAVWLRIPNLR